MKWKAEVQFEVDTNIADNQATGHTTKAESAIDETWIRFSGSWGQIYLGNQDGVEDAYLTNDEYAVGKAGDGGTDGNWQGAGPTAVASWSATPASSWTTRRTSSDSPRHWTSSRTHVFAPSWDNAGVSSPKGSLGRATSNGCVHSIGHCADDAARDGCPPAG